MNASKTLIFVPLTLASICLALVLGNFMGSAPREVQAHGGLAPVVSPPTWAKPESATQLLGEPIPTTREDLASEQKPAAQPKPTPLEPSPEELQEFHAYVDDALFKVRISETDSMLLQLEERSKNLDRRMSRLESDLRLDPKQSERLRGVLWGTIDQEREYIQRRRSGIDDDLLRTLQREDRNLRLEELRKFLTEKQALRFLKSTP